MERVLSKSVVGLPVGAVYCVCDRDYGMYRVVQTAMLRKAVKMNCPANLQCNTLCCVLYIRYYLCIFTDCKDLQVTARQLHRNQIWHDVCQKQAQLCLIQPDTGHLSEPHFSDSRDIHRANYFISTIPSFYALKGLLP